MAGLSRTEGASCTIEVAGIPVVLTRKKVKNLSLRIARDGTSSMNVPMNCPFEVACNFARKNSTWLIEHSDTIERLQAGKQSAYEDGSTTYVWGKAYRVKWETAARKSVAPVLVEKDGSVVLRLPKELQGKDDASLEARRAAIQKLRREELQRVLPEMSRRCERLTGLSANEWRTKAMSTRWGTCSIKAKRVWIAVDLAAHDPSRLEYVCVHELCHLLESGHGERFQALMTKYLPTWRATKKALNKEAPLP